MTFWGAVFLAIIVAACLFSFAVTIWWQKKSIDADDWRNDSELTQGRGK